MRRAWAVWWMTLALPLYPGAVLAQRTTVPATFAQAAAAVRPAIIDIVVPRAGSAPDLFWGEPVEEDLSGGPWSSVGAGVIVETSGVAITSARVVQGTPGIEAVTSWASTSGATSRPFG